MLYFKGSAITQYVVMDFEVKYINTVFLKDSVQINDDVIKILIAMVTIFIFSKA